MKFRQGWKHKVEGHFSGSFAKLTFYFVLLSGAPHVSVQMWVERSISTYSVASQGLEKVPSIPVVCVRTSAFENLEAKYSSSPSSSFFF